MKLLSSLFAVAVIVAAVYNALPTTATPPVSKVVVAPANTPLPLRIAILLDLTASRKHARIATSVNDFEPLFKLLEVAGGEIGFGTIRDDSNWPFVRCFVQTPPAAPSRTAPGTGNVFITANNKRRDDDELRAYEIKRRAWANDAKARVAAFQAAIAPLLDGPATAPATDLTAAIERGDLMLSEPSAFPQAALAIVLISDGCHNASAGTVPKLRSSARVVVVNGVGSIGTLSTMSPEPLRFESTEAAIRYLATDGGANGR